MNSTGYDGVPVEDARMMLFSDADTASGLDDGEVKLSLRGLVLRESSTPDQAWRGIRDKQGGGVNRMVEGHDPGMRKDPA